MVKWRNQRGTASLAEYILLVFLIVTVFAAMTTYVRRSLQARIRDTRNYMIRQISQECVSSIDCMEATGLNATSVRIGRQYEPYYTKVQSDIRSDKDSKKGVWATDKGGTAFARDNARIKMKTGSTQSPPKMAADDIVLGSR